MRRVVITGLGCCTPLGIEPREIWQNVCARQSACQRLPYRISRTTTPCFAGRIQKNLVTHFPPRSAKRLDRFTQLALLTAQHALAHAGFTTQPYPASRVGIYVGNCWGGWQFAENELRRLYTEGSVSPYLATAWFPAAAQGEISIAHQCKGHSKTIDAGEASGLISIGYAARAIQAGRLDAVLAGGVDAPLNAFTWQALQKQASNTEKIWSTDGSYQPFARSASGRIVGEGAAFVVLETLDNALRRGATPYAEIAGFSHATAALPPTLYATESTTLHRVMQHALDQAQLTATHIDGIFADGACTLAADQHEINAITALLGTHSVPLSVPKAWGGHLFAASGALDIGLAALALTQQCILPTPTPPVSLLPPRLYLHDTCIPTRLEHLLVNARSYGGMAASILLKRSNQNTLH